VVGLFPTELVPCPTHNDKKIVLSHYLFIIVPTPFLVKISINKLCSNLPSKIWTRLTSFCTASKQFLSFGIIPPVIIPLSNNSLADSVSIFEINVSGVFGSSNTPSISVKKTSLLALTARAIAVATSSALIL